MHLQNPYPPPPGLVAPLGPPQRIPAGARSAAVVLLGAALVGLSTFGGYEVARNGGGRLQVLLWYLPAIACLVALSTLLRDDVAGVTVDADGLRKAGPAVRDVVGRAVWAGQEQGRYVVPRAAAGVWGMPTRPGAPATGRTGTAGKALAVVGLLLLGTVVGVVLALA